MWWNNSCFYHIHPMTYFAAPAYNDFSSPPTPRLNLLYETIGQIRDLGCNALYLGPLFESTSHGYDTVDYYHVDRRLGDDRQLKDLIGHLHGMGVKVVIDGVFNHVGRNFWAFHDLRTKGPESPYRGWFRGVNFRQNNAFGDGFRYKGWEGHESLVSLNLNNPDLRNHILKAVQWMIEDLAIDGLRLDVAYMLNREFMAELSAFCKERRDDFFLLGEMIHGNYTDLVNGKLLNSVTNYSAYKGLWSSHNDHNLFEIAHTLSNQFGEYGTCRNLSLLNFADNHDVDRLASQLKKSEHLYTLYTILFTMPGIPSIYYGSEWQAKGRRTSKSDAALRPPWHAIEQKDPTLFRHIQQLTEIRQDNPWLATVPYRQLHIQNEELAFIRQGPNSDIVTALNISDKDKKIKFPLPKAQTFNVLAGRGRIEKAQGNEITLAMPSAGHLVLSSG